MKPGIKNRLEVGELSGDWDEDKKKVADVVNKAIDRIYTAFNKDLTLNDNLDVHIKELDFRFDDIPVEFRSDTKRPPKFMLLGRIRDITTGDHVILGNVSLPDYEIRDRQIFVNYVNGLEEINDNGERPLYRATFVIFGEDQ